MRNILILCGLTLIGGGFLLWRATRPPVIFGQFAGAQVTAVAELATNPAPYLKRTVAVEGQIRRQCRVMGCFFFFESGGKELRIDLEAITMTAPNHEGGRARVEGQLVPFGDGYQLSATAIQFL